MGIYRYIGIVEVAKSIAAIIAAITFIICLFIFPIFLRHGNDAVCMSLAIAAIVGAITFIAFSTHEDNAAPENDSRERKNEHAGRRKHRKTK